jgi:hypothetical protein
MARFTLQTALIATTLLQACCVFAQAIFAGSFLSGSDAMVRVHEIGGWVTFAMAMVQVILIALPAGRRYGIWLLISSVGIATAETLQLGTGYGRFLQVHIPLSVLIVGGLVWQVVWISRKEFASRG